MVIREKLTQITDLLKKNNIENYLFEAHCIIRHATSFSPTELVLNHNSVIQAEQEKNIDFMAAQRICGRPLQYIIGTQEFMSLEFIVNESVLIPRADTETLVEYVLEEKHKTGFSLLDIGTGTGCIPLSIAHYNPRAFVRGLDISRAAIDTARKNCENLGLTERANFYLTDIMSEVPHGKYDVITSNPPYIRHDVISTLQTEVKDYEPHTALDGGHDGLKFYRRITEIAPNLLNPGGFLVFEIGSDQGDDVMNIVNNYFDNSKIIKDLCGNDRVVVAKSPMCI